MDSSFNLAVHALVCLSHSGRSLSSEALAENICTNSTRVRRVLAGLKKAGMVETREGLDGGYRLTADPASLSLRQVAEAVNTRFVDCAWHSGDIDRNCAICSGMAGVMDTLYRQMNEQCAAYRPTFCAAAHLFFRLQLCKVSIHGAEADLFLCQRVRHLACSQQLVRVFP